MISMFLTVQSLLLHSSGYPAVCLWESLFQVDTFRPQPAFSLGDAALVYLLNHQCSKNFDFCLFFFFLGGGGLLNCVFRFPATSIFIVTTSLDRLPTKADDPYHFETLWCFTTFSFHHNWNDARLLLIRMIYTSCLTGCQTTQDLGS